MAITRMTKRKGCPAKGATMATTFLEYLSDGETKNEAIDTVRGLLKHKESNSGRVMTCCPAGSKMAAMMRDFERLTPTPLEIPLSAFVHSVSTYLMLNGVSFEFGGKLISPGYWVIATAPSSSFKSPVAEWIQEPFNFTKEQKMPNCASSARWIDAFSERNGRAFWFEDEIAQLLGDIETAGHPRAPLRGMLLLCYNGADLEKETKKDKVLITKPRLSIYGLNVLETLAEKMSIESLTDGFAQRFVFFNGVQDNNRPPNQAKFYQIQSGPLIESARLAAEPVFRKQISTEPYKLSAEGEYLLATAFEEMSDGSVPDSFHRRIFFQASKYALAYHFILGEEGNEIGAAACEYALRICMINLTDTRSLIEATLSDLNRMLSRIEEQETAIGRELTVREVIQKIHGIQNVSQAKSLVKLLHP